MKKKIEVKRRKQSQHENDLIRKSDDNSIYVSNIVYKSFDFANKSKNFVASNRYDRFYFTYFIRIIIIMIRESFSIIN